ncbi:condensation domain-containing protein [Nonomuraea sp. NPDC003560]|uniref:condensation domain-containing protein n=1 Tax=Nonomuraea sp. NPDC003560 TaxID=3364341 RepID=UPI0036AAD1BA
MTTEIPFTYAQQLLLGLEQAVPGSVVNSTFIVRAAYRVAHEVDAGVLRLAVDDVVARHDALRTAVSRDPDGEIRARVHESAPGRLLVHDVDDEDAFLAMATGSAYPPEEPPLLWVHLGRCADGTSLLVIVAHHLTSDAWSLPLLARDLSDAYTARLRGGPPPGSAVMGYAEVAADDFSPAWERTITDALPYWKERLDGVAELAMPVPTPGRRGDQRTCRFTVPGPLWRDLGRVARRRRTTPFTLLLTAFTASVWAGRHDAVVPVITAGRKPSEWYTAGFMLNMLWLRITTGDPADLDELSRRADEACRAAYRHDVPLLRVLPEAPELAAVMFDPSEVVERTFPVFQLIPRTPFAPTAEDPALVLTPVPEERQPAPVMPVHLLWSMRVDEEVVGIVSYEAAMFGRDWVEAKVAGFLRVLERLADA